MAEQSLPRQSSYTIFECPECGHWHGEADGLWAKPSRCPRCIRRIVKAKPLGTRNYTTMTDVQKAPMTVPVEVGPLAS